MNQDKNQAGDQNQSYTNIQSGENAKNSNSLTNTPSTQEAVAQSSYEGNQTMIGGSDNEQGADDRRKTIIYAMVVVLLTISAVVLGIRIYNLWNQRGGEPQKGLPSSVDQDNSVIRQEVSPAQNQEPEEVVEEVINEVDNLDLDELDAVDKQIEQDMNQL